MHLCVATSPYCDTVNGSFNQLQFIWWYYFIWITVVILELFMLKSPDFWKECIHKSQRTFA